MSAWHRKACRDCELPGGGDVKISKKGYCQQCGMRRALDATRSMITKTGEHYERHTAKRDAMSRGGRARGVGGTPL